MRPSYCKNATLSVSLTIYIAYQRLTKTKPDCTNFKKKKYTALHKYVYIKQTDIVSLIDTSCSVIKIHD